MKVVYFHNETPLPNAARFFTQSFTEEMYKIKPLNVISAVSKKKADSYLIGVLRSEKEHYKVFKRDLSTKANILTPQNAQDNENIVPITNRVEFFVDIYILKNPELADALIENREIFDKADKVPGLVLKKVIKVDIKNLAKEINDGSDFVVNSTQNYRALDKALKEKSKEVALRFSNTYLYEF